MSTEAAPAGAPLRVILVDPSLYTAPYDAALHRGLLDAGVQPTWTTRPPRRGEREVPPAEHTDAFFYRRSDAAAWLPGRLRALVKGCAHVAGSVRLLRKVRGERPQVVHVQWIVVPLVDVAMMALLRRWCPLVLTVHDSVPWNGQRMSWLQRAGHELPLRLASRIIVHTRSGREALLRHRVPAQRVAVIPHGPLALAAAAPPAAARDPRWTMVLFGEIKPYKGLDVLVEAVAALAPQERRQLRVIVAGRPRMDLQPLLERIGALRVAPQFELRLGRLTEGEMAALFAEADGFVFPYRQIDASGVYYLVKSLGKWLIASRVGVFAEELAGQGAGAVVPPEDPQALAGALRHAIRERPRGAAVPPGGSWTDIGRATRRLYEGARAEFDARRVRA